MTIRELENKIGRLKAEYGTREILDMPVFGQYEGDYYEIEMDRVEVRDDYGTKGVLIG